MTSGAPFSSIVPDARGRAGNDPIFALNAEAARRAAGGESILNATMGALITDEGKLAVMPTVLETLSRVPGSRAAGYPPIAGTPDYRAAVTRDLFGEGPLAKQAVTVATPGGTGAVYEAVVNFLEPGQKVLTASYYWGPYVEIARHSGRGLDTFSMFGPDGAFDVEALARELDRHASTQGRALVIFNFPCHNPTGYTLSDAEWRSVAEVVARVGERVPVTVLIDAAYMRFGGDAATSWVSALPAILESATVLVAWTASKSFTQYGARVGALVALHRDPTELDQIANALGYSCRATWSNCNHMGQLAISQILTDPELTARCDAERAELIGLLQERIDTFNELAGAAGLSTPRYDSGFFVAVFTSDEQATAAKMRELGVYVTPIPGAVRVALCSTPASTIPRLVEALGVGVGVEVAR
jgi:aromatic-amino-acid transaminase